MNETPQSEQELSNTEPQEAEVQPKRDRRFKKRHFAQALLRGVFGFGLALLVGFVLLIGRDLRAPEWLQQRVEERLAEALPTLDINLGSIFLRIESSDLSPRVFLQNVSVRDETGLPFASLSELSVRASFPAALQGQFSPKKVSLSGALMKLRRASDGSFDLTIGSALQSTGQGASLVELIERLDQLLVRPELQYLREVEANSLTVLYEDARAGRAWTVDGGRMRLSTKNDQLSMGADFALLGGQDYATTLEMSYDSDIGSPAAQIGLTLADAPSEDIASQSEALAWMEALRAPISGSLRTVVDDRGELGPLNATLQIGEGVVQPEDEAKPIPFEGAQAYFTYEPDDNILEFSELNVKSAWFEMRGEGRARMQNAPGGWPEAMLGQFSVSSIKANPDGLYPEPVTLEQADVDMRLVFDPFRLDIGQLVLREAGQVLIASAQADIGLDGWRLKVDAGADTLEIKEVLRVWPDDLKQNTRTWIANNILKGELSKVRLAFRAEAGAKPDLHLGFAFDDASVRFMKQMPPLQEGRGFLHIDDERLIAVAEKGVVIAPKGGRVDVSSTVFEIPDMRLKGAPANIQLETQSAVTAALSLLDQKPFEFLSKAGQSVDLAQGRAVLSGDITLPLKQQIATSEIEFDIAGKISDVRSETLVDGRVLAARQLDLRALPDQISLDGAGSIDGVTFEGAWRMPLGTPGAGSQVSGQIELSERFVNAFNIGLPKGSVSGQGQGQITLDLKPDVAPNFALTSNLAGLGLRIDPLGWRLGTGTRGQLSVRGRLGSAQSGPPRVTGLTLDAPGLFANGAVTIRNSGSLERASFQRVKAGDWLDAPLTLTGRGANVTPAVTIAGGSLDMRRIPAQNTGGSGAAGGSVPLDVTLDRLQVTSDMTLRNFKGAFVSDRGLTGDFSGDLNGQMQVTGRTLPKGGRTAVEIKSSNAGRVISAAGLLSSANEGALTLRLDPRAAAGEYDGTLAITNIRLRDAPPALAVLSAASGIGLLEQMDGRGLMFAEVDATFRITPSTITVTKASAVGPSLGLSVDGYYNVARKTMDMQGVVSPFFAINGIGSIFTRRGEGLIGFNYTAQGPAASPNVQVNPLSLFTPGMFREIFRRPPPQLSQ
ncbi:DUF3971 domain-containing protein [Planktotalea sp.]|uniref:YhdP family protein n=1 Tax=Planktotalea sp. TaxID=2029877 RepID=UPI00329772FD